MGSISCLTPKPVYYTNTVFIIMWQQECFEDWHIKIIWQLKLPNCKWHQIVKWHEDMAQSLWYNYCLQQLPTICHKSWYGYTAQI